MSASVQPGAASSSDPRLADHAASAAVYVTRLEEKKRDPRELPEEVVRTGTPPPSLTLASASAAASHAQRTQRPLEFWTPKKEPAAERAAYHAKDYQPVIERPQTPTRLKAEGSRAALMAVRDRRAAPAPPEQQEYDRIAAEQVRISGGHIIQGDVTAGRQRGALHAASGAYSISRRRAESAPTKPIIRPEATEARHAASVSHRTRPRPRPTSEAILESLDRSMEASRIHNVAKANVQLYTSKPPVDLEAEEKHRRDTLRAAAVSMAKGMYAISRNKDEQGLAGQAIYAAQRGHIRARQNSLTAIRETATFQRPVHLQEAAQKLASEKLARLQQEHEAYRAFYGTSPPPGNRLSMTSMLRRRTSSEGDASKIDVERSMAIRNQMSTLQDRLQKVDEKRRRDRDDLMEVARRNVDAALHDMDERVYAETGRPSLAIQREWEEKAQERARLESEGRLALVGKLDIGGARYVDAVDVEAVARSRIQPTLDEIAERAEEQRARELERRLDEEERRRREAIERERAADTRAEQKKQKAADRQAAKEERAALAEQRRHEKKEQRPWRRQSRRERGRETTPEREETPEAASRYQSAQEGMPTGEVDVVEAVQTEPVVPAATDRESAEPEDIQPVVTQPEVTHPEATQAETTQPASAQSEDHENVIPAGGEAAANAVAAAAAAEEPSQTSLKGESKIRAWFRGRRGRQPRKPSPPSEKATESGPETAQRTSSFVGGAALTGAASTRAASRDSGRGTALSSHPVTESDLAQIRSNKNANENAPSRRSSSNNAEPTTPPLRQWSTSTVSSQENRESQEKSPKGPSPTQANGTGKRARLRRSFMNMLTGKSDGTSPTSPTAEKAGDGAAQGGRPEIRRVTSAEREQLGNGAAETLPQSRPTPQAGQVSGSPARDSRFSEAL